MHDNRAPVDARLMAIEHSLFPVQTRIDELESAVRGLRMPTSDFAPVLERINQLQEQLENPPVRVREGTRNLLSRPGHGEPDDLTQLKGVPKVLERTLHKVGVFYFWQIAEWSPDDVKYVDSKLAAYSGRIERDDWVSQAAELAAAPGAAPGRRSSIEHRAAAGTKAAAAAAARRRAPGLYNEACQPQPAPHEPACRRSQCRARRVRRTAPRAAPRIRNTARRRGASARCWRVRASASSTAAEPWARWAHSPTVRSVPAGGWSASCRASWPSWSGGTRV